jgi:hypothetical protein
MSGPIIHDHNRVFHKIGEDNVAFEASNQDLTDATYHYFGYISSFGSWIIQRFHIISDAIIYEYAAGKTRTDYDSYWNANGIYIGTLTFTTFDQLADSL